MYTDSAGRHDVLISGNVDIMGLLKALSDVLSQLSKDTDSLKGAVSKVDQELTKSLDVADKRSVASEQAEQSTGNVIHFSSSTGHSITNMCV